ncbi:thermonuclease family protein [Hydrogenophaga sp. SNF1]|uniref:thermonuclease family protein n=1 Tax=Hydrogenophaga sp. SNF1 TaxID=3098762 RepID=UPI002ACC10FF|nr:thermonuclease family protein [Hydrogenophaga sp. SNF1]WQB82786.1 thermonuclease family protein [Hydrogenophaga sp. SNF1]
MRRFAAALAGALLAGLAVASAAGETVYSARVMRVFDGDTLWVQPASGGRWRKLRLDGLDAPEICQRVGVAARDALAARVLNRSVTVHVRARDGYGRGLARLAFAGEDTNAWLVRAGWAWAARWRGQGRYVTEEARAREARRGVWGGGEAPEAPRDFRRRHGPCEPPGPAPASAERRGAAVR